MGKSVCVGRRGRKAFARPDEDPVEDFQIQIEGLIGRSCQYFLDLIMEREGNGMYDKPDDDRNGIAKPGEELADEVDHGEMRTVIWERKRMVEKYQVTQIRDKVCHYDHTNSSSQLFSRS